MKYIILAVLGCLLAASCILNFSGGVSVVGDCTEEGIDYTEVRELDTFKAISSSLPCNIYFSQSDKQEVRVETTEELAPKVLTVVEDGTLKLKMEKGNYPKIILRIVISAPGIEAIGLHSSGDLRHEGVLDVDNNLDISASGSGDIQMGTIACKDFKAHTSGSGNLSFSRIACDGFSASASGSGDIDIATVAALDGASVRLSGSGHARLNGLMAVNGDMDLSTSGSGDIDLETLTASGNVSALTRGSGHIRLRKAIVDGDMDLKASGSGDISVNGSCHDVTASTSGSGDISGDLSHAGMRVKSSGSGDINL